MYIMVSEFSSFTACVVGNGVEVDDAIVVAVDGIAVDGIAVDGTAIDDTDGVSAKSCCTFEMFALMAEEMSAKEDLTIATTTFLVTTAIDDPGGD